MHYRPGSGNDFVTDLHVKSDTDLLFGSADGGQSKGYDDGPDLLTGGDGTDTFHYAQPFEWDFLFV